MKIPCISKQENAVSFFSELIALNSDNRAFSQRALSLKLKWPSSYITDILKGRRGLTISRAIQFASYFQFEAANFKKLIFLAIESSVSMEPQDLERIRSVRIAGHAENCEHEQIMITD